MAGKHSKSIFDIKFKPIKFKNPIQTIRNIPKARLPFVITTLFLVVSLVLSLCFVGAYFISGNKQRKILSYSAEVFNDYGGNEAIKRLAVKNDDIIGFINIENTNICYAVCQGDNDTHYLNHNQFGNKSRYGALFLSYTDSFDRRGDKNIVIYGNNIKDGSLFGSLDKYRNLNFYKQNPCIDIYFG
jgi:SrtB family sortase